MIPFYYGSGSGTVIYYSSGSVMAKSYGSYVSGYRFRNTARNKINTGEGKDKEEIVLRIPEQDGKMAYQKGGGGDKNLIF